MCWEYKTMVLPEPTGDAGEDAKMLAGILSREGSNRWELVGVTVAENIAIFKRPAERRVYERRLGNV